MRGVIAGAQLGGSRPSFTAIFSRFRLQPTTIMVSGTASSMLGGVDKFEPVSGGGEMDHAEEAVGELIVSGSDGAVDLEMAEHALDTIALLVERPVMFDLDAAV